ncbi:hypothetical protein AWW67_02180 [Roseivirga seohaensis]|uniref:Uncharacterized protein n=1 Tax=Roseivirga seohaensis TaxID=1914963 RepID=A0A150XZ09_9BACT|nr:hypothetical protein [Roseivirga seohaensis]KYG83948.1 hypothetical protein AWW67_02180 [Roseivirga seohaensis]
MKESITGGMNPKREKLKPFIGFATREHLRNAYRLGADSFNKVLLEIELELGFETKGKKTFSPKEYTKIFEILGHPYHE